MSLLEVNEFSPNEKLSGCGDGIRNGPNLGSPLRRPSRTPIPSCRRFCTRPSPVQRAQSACVKAQLQKAIEELATHPNITRRRALTMAEITPTRNAGKKTDGLQLSSPAGGGTGGAKALVAAAAPSKQEDAGRRVYQLLLLNAWRRRRTQVATLSESLGALETQNSNLELQIDALKRLRLAECGKRTEAVAETQILHGKLEKMLAENQVLKEEKAVLGEELSILEDKTENLQLCFQNSQNDWMTARCELKNIEHQLGTERGKIKKLRDKNHTLLEELSRKELNIAALHDQLQNLQEELLTTELKLQDTILTNNTYEKDKKDLIHTLNREIVTKTELQKQLQESTSTKEKLEIKLQDLRKNINSNSEFKKQLEEENQVLKNSLADSREALIQEQQKPWWKCAGKLALVSLNTLKNVAEIMLPAVPKTNLQTSLAEKFMAYRDC